MLMNIDDQPGADWADRGRRIGADFRVRLVTGISITSRQTAVRSRPALAACRRVHVYLPVPGDRATTIPAAMACPTRRWWTRRWGRCWCSSGADVRRSRRSRQCVRGAGFDNRRMRLRQRAGRRRRLYVRGVRTGFGWRKRHANTQRGFRQQLLREQRHAGERRRVTCTCARSIRMGIRGRAVGIPRCGRSLLTTTGW